MDSTFGNVAPDAPLRLSIAAKLAFPDGSPVATTFRDIRATQNREPTMRVNLAVFPHSAELGDNIRLSKARLALGAISLVTSAPQS